MWHPAADPVLKRTVGRTGWRRRLLTTSALVVGFTACSSGASLPYRAFTADSYWNTPLPANAPIDPRSARIIGFLRTHDRLNYIRLAGASATGRWGTPIYWASPDDKSFSLGAKCGPPAGAASTVPIPAGARPDSTSDAEMTVYDRSKGVVYGLWRASYDAAAATWSACRIATYYLSSNGLAGSLPQSDEPRNQGHRGVPPPVFAVRYDEVRAGAVRHVLKVSVASTGCSHVFPMTADECGTRAPGAPPEGARIRIRPSVSLASLHLSPPSLVVARALQRYGAVIGDQSGNAVTLKLENTVAEGRGFLWKGGLGPNALSSIPLSDYEIVRLGYRR
jgi:hypothetical protein